MKAVLAAGLLAFLLCRTQAAQVGIATILPSLADLGSGWTSNSIAVLLDPLSSPGEVAEGPAWRESARRVVSKPGFEAHAVARYFYGTNGLLVLVNRLKTKDDIREDWWRDPETKAPSGGLPAVGEEVRFYRRHGMHSAIAFRRGNYLIEVETVAAPMDKVRQMAELLDAKLLKLQRTTGL